MPFHIMEQRGGGAEVQAWLLAKELARRGCDVSYVAQSMNNKQGQKEIIDGVTVKWIKYAHHFRWSNGMDYYKALKELNPGVIVQRMTSFITGIAGLYSKKHNKKFIWVCTDNASPVKWFFLKNQIRVNKEYNVGLSKALAFLFNAFIYDISRHWGMRQVTHSFTQNEEQKKLLKKEYGLDSYRIISGHDFPKNFYSPEQRLAKKIVLWVANLGPGKRPEKFIELARLGKNTKLRFVMIGSRTDESYIKALFRHRPDNLEWLGRLSFDETLRWFNQASFLINTSICEGFPNTFIQSWLRGIPVLTLGVNPDGVIHRHNLGNVANDLNELMEYINFLINHDVEYNKISKNVMEYAKLHYSIEKMSDNFLNIVLKQSY